MLLAYDFRPRPFMRGRVRLRLAIWVTLIFVWRLQREEKRGRRRKVVQSVVACLCWWEAEVEC